MRETHSGNKMAESKEEASTILRGLAIDNMLSTIRLNESEYSNQILYKYFDNISEAERELFGERTQNEYVCDYCGSIFENRGGYTSHTNNCSEERVEANKKATELLSQFSLGNGYAVYVLKIMHDDGDVFWYVGESSQVEKRIRKHIWRSDIKIPDEDGLLQGNNKYTISSVEEVEFFDAESKAREMERRRAFELCLEHETLNIIGGR